MKSKNALVIMLWFFCFLGWAEVYCNRPLSAGILFLVGSVCGLLSLLKKN